MEGIKTYGISPWHRKSFGICKNSQVNKKLTKHFMKMLEEKQMIQTNCTNNSTQNTNSHNKTLIGTQNITISLGSEDVLGTLSQKEKLKILNERYMSVLDLIKLIN